MFEKCGLRDIFVRIGRLKWLILVFVIIGAAVGSLMYIKDVSAYNADVKDKDYKHRMYAGYAYYYVSPEVTGGDTTKQKLDAIIPAYIKTFLLRSTSYDIYKALREKYDKEELGELLNAEMYADISLNKYMLCNRNYGIRAVADNTMLEIKVCAETREVCVELLRICREKLNSIAKTRNDSTIKIQGKYTRYQTVGKNFFSAQTEGENSESETEAPGPGPGSIIAFMMIGLLAGIVIAIALAVFVPTINRDSDFEAYGIQGLGNVNNNRAAALAGIVLRKAKKTGTKNILLVSTIKKDKKISALVDKMKTEIEACGGTVSYVNWPEELATAGADEQDDGLIIAIEKKGVSKHHIFDEMKHYYEVMEKTIDGAALIV